MSDDMPDHVRNRIMTRTSDILWDYIRFLDGEIAVSPLVPSTRFILGHYKGLLNHYDNNKPMDVYDDATGN